jgi:type II secretory pathway component PulF
MVVGLVVALIATGILSKAWPEYESIFQFRAPVGAQYSSITNFGDATRAITYLVGLTLGFVAGQVVFVVRFWRR